MPKDVDHVAYIHPGIVDGAVVKAQAEARFTKLGEVTVVHNHAREDHNGLFECNNKCRIYDGEWKGLVW